MGNSTNVQILFEMLLLLLCYPVYESDRTVKKRQSPSQKNETQISRLWRALYQTLNEKFNFKSNQTLP